MERRVASLLVWNCEPFGTGMGNILLTSCVHLTVVQQVRDVHFLRDFGKFRYVQGSYITRLHNATIYSLEEHRLVGCLRLVALVRADVSEERIAQRASVTSY
jgi:hypothetical protein